MKRFIFTLLALGGVSGIAHAQGPSPQCVNRDDGSSICVGDRILDYRDATGTLQTIYSDLTAVVDYDGGDINTIDLQYVSREVSCIYGFCAGDAIADDSNLDENNDPIDGAITDLYENGMAEVTDDGGETFYYVEVNNLTDLQSDAYPVNYAWAPPRPFPDLTVYACSFPAPDNLYGWPEGYPYPRPILGRQLHGVFPMPPQHIGLNHFNPYPFAHPVAWQGGGSVHVNFGNRHPGFNPGNGPGNGPGGRGGMNPPPRGGQGGHQPIPQPQPQPQPPHQNPVVPGPYHPGNGGNGGGQQPPRQDPPIVRPAPVAPTPLPGPYQPPRQDPGGQQPGGGHR